MGASRAGARPLRDLDKTKAQLIAELGELRARAAGLHPEPGASRLLEQQHVLLGLALQRDLFRGELEPALQAITEAAGECLAVARTSVWVYDAERTLIRCLNLYQRESGDHTPGL